MKTREQLKGEVEDIREELQREYHWPRMRRLIRELEVKRRAIRCHEIMMGLGLMLAICMVGCDPPDNGPEPPVEPRSPSKGVSLSSKQASPLNRAILMNISAFCPGKCCCQHWANMTTANNHRIKYGDRLVAAPRNYPFGTWMSIVGYGRVQVKDRGGAITGSKLDVLFYEKSQDPKMTDIEWSHQLALEWGRKYLEVVVELSE